MFPWDSERNLLICAVEIVSAAAATYDENDNDTEKQGTTAAGTSETETHVITSSNIVFCLCC